MADDILPRDLNPAASVPADSALIIDDGVNVERATPAQLVDSGRPIATEPEAVAGVVNNRGMTPLTTRQAVEARAITVPAGEPITPLPPAASRVGGKVLGFNAVTGEPEVIGPVVVIPGSGNLDGGDANVSGDGTGDLDGGTA